MQTHYYETCMQNHDGIIGVCPVNNWGEREQASPTLVSQIVDFSYMHVYVYLLYVFCMS